MKVCHVATVDLSVRFLLLNQLLYLKRQGLDIHAACSDGAWLPEVESAGVVVHRVAMKRTIAPFSDLAALVSLVRLFRRERFDLVHLHTPKASLLGGLASRLAGVPRVVCTIHGFYFHDGMAPARLGFYRFWERIVSLCVDVALSQNRSDVETALREGLYREGRIEFLGNGIDVRRFDPAAIPVGKRAGVRRSLGIPEDARVLGIVARLVEEKGYPELFRAMKVLLAEFPDLHLLAVGPRDEMKRDSLSPEAVHAMGIADRVVFTGMRLDLPDLYSVMDLFVLPSHREGFPRVVMEASSMGLPVVASDIRGCREAVEDGVTGILFPVRDVDGLARGVARLLREPGLAEAMGIAGRRKAREEFDEEKVFAKVVRTYRQFGELGRSGVSEMIIRARDVFLSALGLLFLSPLMGSLALLVLWDLGPPILFTQLRPGLKGKLFTLRKFRTMKEGRTPEGKILPDADRLTPLGKWMRSTSLDELPGLYSVLKGDMSLVGPRPLLPQYLGRYTPEQARRHEVRPGITGWAQVNGRNAITWEEKFELDVWYVDHRTFLLDARILTLTLWRGLRREGVTAEGEATMPEFLGTSPSKRKDADA